MPITTQQKKILSLMKKGYILRNVRANFKSEWILFSPKGVPEMVPTRTAISLLEFIKIDDEFYTGDYSITEKTKQIIK